MHWSRKKAKSSYDWQALEPRLQADEAIAWGEAYDDFFRDRLERRYLHPIRILQTHGTYDGEGFSIAAIQCSLIEFLESTRLGKSYRYCPPGKKPGVDEYSKSKEIFTQFLMHRAPFSKTFASQKDADEFYSCVRCGLLHEARTTGAWLIKAKNKSGDLVADVQAKEFYRDDFQNALEAYIMAFCVELLADQALKRNFIKKFNTLYA